MSCVQSLALPRLLTPRVRLAVLGDRNKTLAVCRNAGFRSLGVLARLAQLGCPLQVPRDCDWGNGFIGRLELSNVVELPVGA